jgi:hypothetical protein
VGAIEAVPFVTSVALARSRDEITDYVTEEAELRPVNPDLVGVSHIAVLAIDTVTEAAAGAVRALILAEDGSLGDVRVRHCSTFIVDYVLDEDQVHRAPFSGDALDGRGRM